MYVFDTDMLSLLEHPDGEAARRLQNRLNQVPSGIEIVTTVISYEEQTRGWFGLLRKQDR